jgi:hypothetical protein
VLVTILLGAALIVATTFIHAGCTALIMSGVRATHVSDWVQRNHWTRGSVISGLVLALYLASVAEAGLWAGVYVWAGVIEGFEKAMYFSVVTYTTLGYGDITLEDYWRLLGSFQAANGIIIFGWSTAIIVSGVQHIYFHSPDAD